MAKRTRYQDRPKAKPAVKRAPRPQSAEPAAARIVSRPAALDAPVEPGDDMPARSSSGLTETELQRAAELEAEANAKEKAAIAESLRRRNRAEREHLEPGDLNAPLKVRAAHEYAYVARDVKRITLTASLMIGILAVLYILTNVLGVIKL